MNEALSCVDFMPTLLSLTDDKLPQGIEGRNASSFFKGDSNNWNDIAFLRFLQIGFDEGLVAGKRVLSRFSPHHGLPFARLLLPPSQTFYV